MKSLIFLLALLFCCPFLRAQNLTFRDLIVLCKADIGHVDSVMKAKGFEKDVFDKNADFVIIRYTYTGAESGSPVMRSVHLGKEKGRKYWEVEYGVWQKHDASDFEAQVTSAGFQKIVRKLPNVGGGYSTYISYRKGNYSIRSTEEPQEGTNTRLYIFSINVE